MKVPSLTIIPFLVASTSLLGASGEIMWEKIVDSSSIIVGQAPNGYIVASGEHRMTALDPDDGQTIWQIDTGNENPGIPVIGGNNVCYTWYVHEITHARRLVAVDLIDGEELWDYETNTSNLGNIVTADGKVYFVDRSSETIYTFDGESGTILWAYASPTEVNQALSYIGGKLFTYELDDASWWSIVALNSDTGAKALTLSKDPTGERWQTGYLTGFLGDKFLAVTSAKNAYILNSTSGDWSVNFGRYGYSFPLVDANGRLYEGAGYCVVGVDGNTGTALWRYEIADTESDILPRAVSSAGVVYCGVVQGATRDDHDLYALDPSELTVKYVRGTPTYFAKLKWSLPIQVSSLIIGTSGKLYVGSGDGSLYCIEGSSSPGDAPWPMIYGNAQNSFAAKSVSSPTDTGNSQTGNEATATFSLQGWSWMETYPWIFNNSEQTWYYMMPVVKDGVAENYLYNYTTQEWRPIQTD